MKNFFEYKGYRGTVSFSAEDRVFFGTIHGINDLVTFEGESVNELETAFCEAVDDYLDICARFGKTPEKAYKGQFNVRISPELHRECAMRAIEEDVSMNQLVENALTRYMDSKVLLGKIEVYGDAEQKEVIKDLNKTLWDKLMHKETMKKEYSFKSAYYN